MRSSVWMGNISVSIMKGTLLLVELLVKVLWLAAGPSVVRQQPPTLYEDQRSAIKMTHNS
eukprot:1693104-Amphidinium_carterae.1